jgi:hypothetical protein
VLDGRWPPTTGSAELHGRHEINTPDGLERISGSHDRAFQETRNRLASGTVEDSWLLLGLALGGVAAGLTLLWRGLVAHGTGIRVSDTGSSRIATLAAGEVRVSGLVEAAEVTIISPLQGATCVWYRARVSSGDTNTGPAAAWSDERGVGFRVADGSGSIRVFPRNAQLDVTDRLDAATGILGDEPAGLRGGPDVPIETAMGGGRRRYLEARLEPGDLVTIVGSAVPFGQLADPVAADSLAVGGVGGDDPEVAADVAEARASGLLVAADDAWGNAAIAGFGVGRPVREPELDPGAERPVLASPDEAAAIQRAWDLAPDELVLASGPDGQLLIAAGSPGEIEVRHRDRYVVGLLGAALAIGSALAAGWLISRPGGP